jgi:hypothetical protein
MARFVAFVRARYPHGVPATDYILVLALARRRHFETSAFRDVSARLFVEKEGGTAFVR